MKIPASQNSSPLSALVIVLQVKKPKVDGIRLKQDVTRELCMSESAWVKRTLVSSIAARQIAERQNSLRNRRTSLTSAVAKDFSITIPSLFVQ